MGARVLGLGNSCCDEVLEVARLPSPGGKERILRRQRFPGGQAAGAMVGCARLGLTPLFLLRVGDDPCGRLQCEALAAAGVDLSLARIVPGAASASAVIVRDASGERIVHWDTPAPLAVAPDDIAPDLIAGVSAVFLDGKDGPACLRAAALAQERGIPVVADLDCLYSHTAALLPLIGHLIVPADFPAQPGPGQVVVVTRGAEGAEAFFGAGERLRAPAFPVDVVDTTGAGDAFHAAYLYALLQGWVLPRRLHFANAAAALACTRLGAQTGLPTLAEVQALLQRRSSSSS